MVQNSLERITSLSNQDLGFIASRAGVEISRLKRLDEKELDVKYEHIKELGNLIQNSLIYISFQHLSEERANELINFCISLSSAYRLIKSPHPQGCFQ